MSSSFCAFSWLYSYSMLLRSFTRYRYSENTCPALETALWMGVMIPANTPSGETSCPED